MTTNKGQQTRRGYLEQQNCMEESLVAYQQLPKLFLQTHQTVFICLGITYADEEKVLEMIV